MKATRFPTPDVETIRLEQSNAHKPTKGADHPVTSAEAANSSENACMSRQLAPLTPQVKTRRLRQSKTRKSTKGTERASTSPFRSFKASRSASASGDMPRQQLLPILLVAFLLILGGLACSASGSDNVIYVTATPLFDANGNIIIPPTMTPAESSPTPTTPTPNPTRVMPDDSGAYMVQPGDTLLSIAQLYDLPVTDILAVNDIPNPNALEVGQVLTIPGGSRTFGPGNKLIPDSELVYSSTASGFSITGTVKFRQGFLKAYSEDIDGETLSGVEIIDFVATNYSVNPRLLLALLEYRGGWLNTAMPDEPALSYPMGLYESGREGLFRQMLDAADALNEGYYGWKYRGNLAVTLGDNTRVLFDPALNPGTVGVQYMLALTTASEQWKFDVSPAGFFQTYLTLFGDPFIKPVEPITPPDLTQPTLTLPFAPGEEWVYTGGPHGGYNSGSAWSAVDFAPPEPPEALKIAQGDCYVSPNWVTAAAPGVIARSGEGYVILDLDGDGDEHTGWTIVHLHMDDYERIAEGTVVQAGDKLAHPSCEGGFSTGTHFAALQRRVDSGRVSGVSALCERAAVPVGRMDNARLYRAGIPGIHDARGRRWLPAGRANARIRE
jgi:LasA protease